MSASDADADVVRRLGLAPRLADVRPYVPGRRAEDVATECGLQDVSKLASNEHPLGPSPRAIDAARAAVAGVHRYPDDAAGALRARLSAEHDVEPAEVVLGHGSNELIDLLCRVFAAPDAHAVVGAPSFSAYALALHTAGVATTTVPLRGGLYWDVDALCAAVDARTRLLFVDTPNNPTSTHLPVDALTHLLDSLPAHVWLVVDEAYHHFVDASDYRSALLLRHRRERLVVLRTFSKAHGLAALRVGYAVGPRVLWRFLHRMRLPFNVNAVGQAAALAALDDTEHLSSYVAHNARERTRLTIALREAGHEVAPSQANFLYLQAGEGGAALEAKLLRAGLIVRPIGAAAEALRISIGTVADNDRVCELLCT